MWWNSNHIFLGLYLCLAFDVVMARSGGGVQKPNGMRGPPKFQMLLACIQSHNAFPNDCRPCLDLIKWGWKKQNRLLLSFLPVHCRHVPRTISQHPDELHPEKSTLRSVFAGVCYPASVDNISQTQSGPRDRRTRQPKSKRQKNMKPREWKPVLPKMLAGPN